MFIGQKNIAKVKMSSPNNEILHEASQRSNNGSTKNIEILSAKTGSLILWIELAPILFESTDNFLEGIDQLLTNLFANSSEEDTEPIRISIFITMVQGNDGKQSTSICIYKCFCKILKMTDFNTYSLTSSSKKSLFCCIIYRYRFDPSLDE